MNLSIIYPCLIGSRMVGSTIFPWFSGRASSLYIEDCLIYSFVVSAVSLLTVAYDYQVIPQYKMDKLKQLPSLKLKFKKKIMTFSFLFLKQQEIGFLVVLFCIFQASVGFILPSLARLRTM